MPKYIYFFEEGSEKQRELLGGKGAGLAEMVKAGLPVPKGFTITTAACNHFLQNNNSWPKKLEKEFKAALKKLEKITGKQLNGEKPLIVSVRSGAAISMPGMMDTVLNIGLNDKTVKILSKTSKNKKFVLDSYRRLIQMFGNVVKEINLNEFEKILEKHKKKAKIESEKNLSEKEFEEIIREYKKVYKKNTRENFPQNPEKQIIQAVNAVFNSWNTKRAVTYRKIHGIPNNLGTAVNIQEMVFGNMDENSGTGVLFTRNPSNGKKELYGEFLMQAQGEDVVAGIRTPIPLNKLKKKRPQIYLKLKNIAEKMEKHYKDMQDMEFTIEQGKLFVLQTRSGKRTAQAAIKIAYDMTKEGILTKKQAVLSLNPMQIEQLLHKKLPEQHNLQEIGSGLPASPGAATGKIVFESDKAEVLANKGEKLLLVRPETTPDDIHGLAASQGVITTRGGMTSHAAIVARGMGKPCIAGCEKIELNLKQKTFTSNNVTVKEGDLITIDGTTGKIFLGKTRLVEPKISKELNALLKWADKFRKLGVRANADTPKDAKKARELGAQGIGLCRTEHMFMQPERLKAVQEMIIAKNKKNRKKALEKLLPFQKKDFYAIFKEMKSKPVIIRLLDPPLHEFLPKRHILKKIIRNEKSKAKKQKLKKILRRAMQLHEVNPMLGHRGCRLAITYPEIYEMQVKAIMKAAVKAKKNGFNPKPKIMIPLIGTQQEMKAMKKLCLSTINSNKKYAKIKYSIGTMIELPRAALTADKIAVHADFFSYGTNDLTQTTYGFSRDDAEGKFLPEYLEKKILSKNPFQTLDRQGVGQLIKIGVEKGKKANKKLEIGICGEHGGDPDSIEFCHKIGLDYVSCSPFRIPIARIAAAQATLKKN